jgi:NDP-sugar pyrophosphorylase family protein
MTEPFPVAILAGGLATRLRPLTSTLPKALIDINGEPFVVHQLRLLRDRGIRQVVLCVGYLSEQIVKVVGNGSQLGIDVTFSYDGPVLLGTAGAVKHAFPKLGNSFFVLYGDSYLECDYRQIQNAFEASGKPGLMTIYRNEGQWETSNVEFAEGRIVAYDKRRRTPRMQYIDYGLGVFNRSAFDHVPPDKPYDLEKLYQDLIRKDRLAVYQATERFYQVGSPDGIAELRQYLAAKS